MISIFVGLVDENTLTLEKALANDDVEAIKKIAHKIKPSIDQMGIVSLKALVRNVEKFDSVGSNEEMYAAVRQIIKVLREVARQVR
jgi:chemotaxis protein histidine kinase CheA